MTPKELIDKITLAAEQLESLRTEHDLPVTVWIEEGAVGLRTSNKKHQLQILVCEDFLYTRYVDGTSFNFFTYEELVEDIR